jgi:hypothetical protein
MRCPRDMSDSSSRRQRIVPVQTCPSSERFQKGATAKVVEAPGRLFSRRARSLRPPSSTRQTNGGCGNVWPSSAVAFCSAFS